MNARKILFKGSSVLSSGIRTVGRPPACWAKNIITFPSSPLLIMMRDAIVKRELSLVSLNKKTWEAGFDRACRDIERHLF